MSEADRMMGLDICLECHLPHNICSCDDLSATFRAMDRYHKQRKAKNLAAANPEGWTKHTEYHWSRTLNGKRLDYWPSSNKFQYNGKVMCGDVVGFINKREQPCNRSST